MGRSAVGEPDVRRGGIEQAFVANGSSVPCDIVGPFWFSASGTFAATLTLEVSFNGGTTWIPVARDTAGSPVTLTGQAAMVLPQPETSALLRMTCSNYVSGTLNGRISA